MNNRIVFFGNERLVSGLRHTDAPILRGLLKNGYDVVAVVSHHSDSASRNNRELEVARIAKEFDIPLFLPNRPSEIINELKALNADAAVLVAYGRIIGQSVIDLFPKGIINIHPSLLPQYRGPTPIESAILNGDSKTGISIMQLSSGMDEGPVFVQSTIELSGDETKSELYQQIADISADLLLTTLPDILSQKLIPTPQNDAKATYCSLIEKSDGTIDWNKSAVIIEREIRGYSDWPQSRTTLGNIEVVICKASVTVMDPSTPGRILSDKNHLYVGTAKDWLEIHSVKPLGKKEMPVTAFLAGYKSKLSN